MQSPQSYTLLVVDTDPGVATLVRPLFEANGFTVMQVRGGWEAISFVLRQRTDAVLLAMHPSGLSGLETCWQIRASSGHTRIVMLTEPGANEDKIKALEAGADDCVVKPLRVRELLARVKAMFRPAGPPPAKAVSGTIEAGCMRLDPERGTLWKSGQEINLSPKEFSLLTLFLANDGLTLSRAELLHAGWGPECGEAQNLRTYIRKLRRKLEDDPRRPRHLLAEPWTGYRFHSSERPSEADHPSGESAVDYRSLRCRLPQYDEPALKALRLDTLRRAIHSNEVSFPHPVPTFKRHDRPDLQHKVVLLYFVSRWDCKDIARRYELTYQRVQQILRTWTRRAIECGYVQFIPPPAVLRSRPHGRPVSEWGQATPAQMAGIPQHPAIQHSRSEGAATG